MGATTLAGAINELPERRDKNRIGFVAVQKKSVGEGAASKKRRIGCEKLARLLRTHLDLDGHVVAGPRQFRVPLFEPRFRLLRALDLISENSNFVMKPSICKKMMLPIGVRLKLYLKTAKPRKTLKPSDFKGAPQ